MSKRKQKIWVLALAFLTLGFANLSAQAPVNDLCSGALSVFDNTPINSSTVGATDDSAVSSFCGTGISAPGVWYEYLATSTSATFSLCGSSYDTKISVFSGACGALTCLDGNDDDCGLQSEVEIQNLIPGAPYFVLVHGFNSASGPFTLEVTPGAAQAPVNDDVLAPLPVSCGDVVFGSTDAATVDSAGTCGTTNSAPGVWYVFIGTGDQVTVTTCAAGTNYDTKISVYDASFFTGAVGSLVCVDGNDDDAGCSFSSSRSTVVFQSQPGVPYWVLIHGFGSATGDFEASLTCTQAPPPIPNDECQGAIPMACGDVVSGSTAGANVDVAPFCGTSDGTGGGVWYVTTGVGGPMEVSTCNAGTNYDTRLRVFEGTCTALTCVDGDDDDANCGLSGLRSTVGWNSTAGQSYYILVHGFGTSEGDFELSLSCPSPPPCDDKCAPCAVNVNDSLSFSSSFATPDGPSPGPGTGASTCNSNDGWCSFEVDVDNDVWFSFVAPGSGKIQVVTDGYDTQVAIYAVDSCESNATYTKLAANDDSGDDLRPGSAIFASGATASCLIPGNTYIIQVDGFNGASADSAMIYVTDPGGSPLTVDAGDCQSNWMGVAALRDTNYLIGSVMGGTAPYTYTWTGPDQLFQVDDVASSTVAAAPTTLGTNIYTITVTDANGCTATDDVEVFVENIACNGGVALCYSPPSIVGQYCIDFENIAAGTNITNQYATQGVHTISASGGINEAQIFDTGNPTGGDPDLATPGYGANNTTALGGALIIQENNGAPDDNANGGTLSFDFASPATVNTITLIDIEETGGTIVLNTLTSAVTIAIPATNDNDVQTVAIGVADVLDMHVNLEGSGAIAEVCYALTSNCVDFDFGGLPAGSIVSQTQPWAPAVTISATNNRSGHPDEAIIFDSGNPTGADWDLGTPNSDFGGPGIGVGGRAGQFGENSIAKGNLLIVAEDVVDNNSDGLVDDPDDEARGGSIRFDFFTPVTVSSIYLVDLDDGTNGSVVTYEYSGGNTQSFIIPDLGNNSVARLPIGQSGLAAITVSFAGSGSIGDIQFCPDTTEVCFPENMVSTLLSTPGFVLGSCGNSCRATNAAVDAPAACVDLTIDVTTDNFGGETSWTLVDVTNNVVLDSVDNGDLFSNTSFTNSYCVDPNMCYEFRIADSFGDGFCCNFGNGTYTVTFDGQVVAQSDANNNPFSGPSATEQAGNCSGNKSNNDAGSQPQAELELMLDAYPNPAATQATFKFSLPEADQVALRVFDLTGTQIATVFEGSLEGGQIYTTDLNVSSLAAGLYIYRLSTAKGESRTGKLYIAR